MLTYRRALLTLWLSSSAYPVSLQFEEQQAFQRSRRFLRQLEISFGENPSHYQKIIKALQGGDDLSQASIHEVPNPNANPNASTNLSLYPQGSLS